MNNKQSNSLLSNVNWKNFVAGGNFHNKIKH